MGEFRHVCHVLVRNELEAVSGYFLLQVVCSNSHDGIPQILLIVFVQLLNHLIGEVG